MEMPALTDEHKQMEKLVGAWIGEETLYPSPWDLKGGKAIGRVVNRKAIAGFAVVQEYEQEREGMTTFQGHGVFRWDAEQASYVFYWFDSMGMAPNEYRGKLEDDVFTMVNKGEQGYSKAIFDFSREGKYHFAMEVSGDGEEWYRMMEGDYTRQE